MWRLLPLIVGALSCIPAFQGGVAYAGAFHWSSEVEEDALALNTDVEAQKRDAIRRFGKYDAAYTRPYLAPLLKNASPVIRAEAGRALARGNDESLVPTALKWLGAPSPIIRAAAADMLASLADRKTFPALLRALSDPDPTVRLRVLSAIISMDSAKSVVPIIDRLEDGSPAVRSLAIDALSDIGDSRALVPMVTLLADPMPQVQLAAIRAVGVLGDDSVVPALSRLLGHSDESVQGAAATALGAIAGTRAAKPLLESLSQGSRAVRSKTLIALGRTVARHPDSAIASTVITRLTGFLVDPGLRGAAQEALVVSGPSAVPVLLESLRAGSGGSAPEIVAILGSIGDKRATLSLLSELERGRINKVDILSALEQTADRRALIPVLEYVADPSPAIRLAALKSTRPLIGKGGQALDVIFEVLDDSESAMVSLAIEILGENSFRRAAPKILQIFERSTDPSILLAAATALGKLREDSAVTALSKVALSEQPLLSYAACDALIEIGGPRVVGVFAKIAQSKKAKAREMAYFSLGALVGKEAGSNAKKKSNRFGAQGENSLGSIYRMLLGAIENEQVPGPKIAALGGITAFSFLESSSNERAIPKAIRAALTSGNSDIVQAAIETASYYALDDNTLFGLLSQNSNSANSLLASIAWSSLRLGELNSKIEALLWTLAVHKDGPVSVNASAALALRKKLNGKKIKMLLRHSHPFVRSNAIFAIGKRRPKTKMQKQAVESVLADALLKDPSPYVRRMAAITLTKLARDAAGAGNAALARAAAKEASPLVLTVLSKARQNHTKANKRTVKQGWQALRVVSESTGRPDPYRVLFQVPRYGPVIARNSGLLGMIADAKVSGPWGELVPASNVSSSFRR